MIENDIVKALMCSFCAVVLLAWPQRFVVAASSEQIENCVDAAAERTITIKSLPVKTHIQTLDGKMVPLKQFFAYCHAIFPWCGIFEKFYYWKNETREVVSDTPRGRVKHKIRCYFNCLSTYCHKRCDALKTHGDIAEFYDAKGNFMGIAVYMGKGKYCSLPYCDYKK